MCVCLKQESCVQNASQGWVCVARACFVGWEAFDKPPVGFAKRSEQTRTLAGSNRGHTIQHMIPDLWLGRSPKGQILPLRQDMMQKFVMTYMGSARVFIGAQARESEDSLVCAQKTRRNEYARGFAGTCKPRARTCTHARMCTRTPGVRRRNQSTVPVCNHVHAARAPARESRSARGRRQSTEAQCEEMLCLGGERCPGGERVRSAVEISASESAADILKSQCPRAFIT
jgi:hypothetical protein